MQRVELALKRTASIADFDDLLRTPEGTDFIRCNLYENTDYR